MKFEIPLLASLLFIGNDFLARAAVQGLEQAVLCTVVNGLWGKQKRELIFFRALGTEVDDKRGKRQ